MTDSSKQNKFSSSSPIAASSARLSASKSPFILGVSGGSGSGKTYFAHALLERLGAESCAIVSQDSFYIDQSQRFDHDGGSVNFDHPDAIEFSLLASALESLKAGHATKIPIYDFVSHKRMERFELMQPKPVIIVDGILILHSPAVRSVCDQTVFVDTGESLRFQRRLQRDVRERGRTPEGVRAQFQNQVKPMHDTFVEPSKKFADLVISEDVHFEEILEALIKRFADT